MCTRNVCLHGFECPVWLSIAAIRCMIMSKGGNYEVWKGENNYGFKRDYEGKLQSKKRKYAAEEG